MNHPAGLLRPLALVAGLLAAGQAHAFSTIGNGWDGAGLGAATVKWHLSAGTPDITSERSILIAALTDWVTTSLVDITFQEVATSGQNDAIDFYFATSLGAPHNFNSDGVLGNLAFGFYPDDINSNPLAGDIVFDEGENWTTTQSGPGSCTALGCDLYYVALHEIGHALGLLHPDDDNNLAPVRVMNPFFNPVPGLGFGSVDTVQADDIAGVCSLYSCNGLGAVVAIPEPTAGLLFAAGLGVAALRLRARSRRHQN